MLSRNNAPATNKADRTRLDAAIIASVLAMGALNLLVLAGQIGPSKAYAAVPCRCGSVAGVALA
jgi:hypothetical protein